MKTHIKNLLLLLLLLGLPAVVQAQDAYSTNADGSIYTYSTNADGSANIVAYAGPPWVVTIPTNINGLTVTSIGNEAFYEVYSLTSVTLPDTVTSIGYEAFYLCTSLKSVTIGNGVTSIGAEAFYETALTNVTIPNSVTSIGDDAFYFCGYMTNVTIGTNVTSIGTFAFTYCRNLTSVTIPNRVTSIGVDAFYFCSRLTNITVDASNPAYSSTNGVLFDKAQATLLQFPGGLGGSYTIPDSVTSIGANAFENDTSLTSVTIPASVASIVAYTFYYCIRLTNATIDNRVTSIGGSAFYECVSLTSVTIPNSVTNIGGSAFYDCISLTNATIDNGVTSIGAYAFGDTGLTSITIGSGVTSIGEGAFFDDYGLTSVAIPGSVTSIGEGAFEDCTNLTNATIDNGVTSIGEDAFANDNDLTSVYFTGNSPSPTNDSSVFSYDPATVYYLPGTTGWGAMFDGLPTAPWFLPNPVILNNGPGFGIQPGGFGFTISWATNVSVVVEAATNLANPVWIPVGTNTLTGGTSYFSDPQWTNYPERFYRVTSAFTVGGTLTGLPAGDTVTLHNGSDNLTLNTNGTFTFPTALPSGQSYSVTISGTSGVTPPNITLMNGSGTISGTNVTNVAVQCTRCPAFTGNMDVDLYNAAVSDGTANGGVPAVMVTTFGGPFRVTARGLCTDNVAGYYTGQGQCVVAQIVGTTSCSSTTLPSGTTVIQFGTGLVCGGFNYGY